MTVDRVTARRVPAVPAAAPGTWLRWTALAAAIAAACAVEQGAGGVPFFRDRMYYFLPQYAVTRAAFAAGEAPLWNPYLNCGQPLLATWQVAVGSPVTLPFLLWPWPVAVRVFWLVALPLAAAGMMALGAEAGLTPGGAAAGAVLYACGGPLRTMGEWPNIVASLVYAPWLLAALARIRRGGRGGTAAVALGFALEGLAGQPRQVFLIGAACVAWLAALRAHDPRRGWGAVRLAAALGLAVALVAFQLLPSAELFARSERLASGVPAETVRRSFLAPATLLTVVAARLWGDERQAWDPTGLLVPRLYLGAAGLALALLGFRRRGPVRTFLWLTAPAALAVATVPPLWHALGGLLGGSGRLRFLGHAALIPWAGLCLAAGAGAEPDRPRGGGRAAFAASLTLVAAAVALAWGPADLGTLAGLPSPAEAPWFRPTLAADLVGGFLALGVAAWARGRRAAGWPAVALVAALGADGGWALRGWEAKAPADIFRRPAVLDRLPLTEGRLFSPIWQRPVGGSAALSLGEKFADRWQVLAPNASMAYGVHGAYGYEPFAHASMLSLFGAYGQGLDRIDPGLRVAGVRWIVAPDESAPRGWLPRGRLLPGWRVWERPEPRPTITVLPAAALSATEWTALLALPSRGEARAVRETFNRLAVAGRSPSAAAVVVSSPWMPGWRAALAGRRVPVERAGGLFPAVRVPAGAFTLDLVYAPLAFAVGLWGSGLAAGGLLVLLAAARLRRA